MVTIAAIPATTNDIASVPISALIRKRVTTMPFTRPTASPTARPATTPATTPSGLDIDDAVFSAIAPARP